MEMVHIDEHSPTRSMEQPFKIALAISCLFSSSIKDAHKPSVLPEATDKSDDTVSGYVRWQKDLLSEHAVKSVGPALNEKLMSTSESSVTVIRLRSIVVILAT